MPVHYAARRALAWDHWAIPRDRTSPLTDDERRELQALYETPARWAPRLLGVACFLAVLRGLDLASKNLEPAQALSKAGAALDRIGWLTFWTWVCLGLFAAFVVYRRAWMQRLGITGVSGAADYARRDAAGEPVRQPYALIDGDLLWFRHLAPSRWREHYRGAKPDFILDWVMLAVIAGFTFVFALAFWSPFVLAETLPRAIFLVLMLGAWVLGLTYVTAWSHRLRAPLLVFGALLATIATAMSARVHDVRNLPPPVEKVAGRQLRLDEAVAAWRAANDCYDRTCPRPIIVAGQGGASRAAFFTASVVGELLDRSVSEPGALPTFARRLFAISSVSGSSLGAVVARGAGGCRGVGSGRHGGRRGCAGSQARPRAVRDQRQLLVRLRPEWG